MSHAGQSGIAPSLLDDLPIRTDRLVLRLPRPGDEVALTPIRNQPRVLAALNKTAVTVERMRQNLDGLIAECAGESRLLGGRRDCQVRLGDRDGSSPARPTGSENLPHHLGGSRSA